MFCESVKIDEFITNIILQNAKSVLDGVGGWECLICEHSGMK
jgi:hypothetical protein